MLLQHKDLTIRNATAADAPALTKWWNDGAVMAHAGFPNGLGITVDEVAEKLSHDSDEVGRRLIIELDGEPFGEMCYWNRGDRTADIGIKICDLSKQEQGYGRVLLCMLVKALFTMGYETVVLDTDLRNERAQHVYEKIGFQKVRVDLDSWTDQLGQKRSSVNYRMGQGDLIDFAL